MGRARTERVLAVVSVMGLALWVAGACELISGAPLALGLLVCGALNLVTAGYLFLVSRPSGRRDHTTQQSFAFCLSCGLGVAALGMAMMALSQPSLALAAATAGLGLIAWSPQAFARHRA